MTVRTPSPKEIVDKVKAQEGAELSREDVEYINRAARESMIHRDNCAAEIESRLLEPLVWTVLDNHVRRAIIMLAILGDRNMRPGGYHWIDLRRLSGVRNSGPTERLMAAMKDLGYLRKKSERYHYRLVYRYDYGSGRRAEALQRLGEEVSRRHALTLLNYLRKAIPGHPRHGFIEGRDYSNAGPGLVVGFQPPDFAVKIIGDIMNSVLSNLFNGFHGIVDIGIERRAAGNEDAYSEEYCAEALSSLMVELREALNPLNDLPKEDAVKWLDYKHEIVRVRVDEGTVILLDLPQIIDEASR